MTLFSRFFGDGAKPLRTARSARDGLELLAKNNVGVIISDQRMPEMTGVEFLKRVKELHPETVRIVLSDHTELQSVTDAINEGAVYKFLVKPWDDELLRANVRGAFRHQELARENEHLSGELKAAKDEILLKIAQESMHQVPLAVVGVDGDGMVALANARAEAMFGNGVPLLGSLVDDTPLGGCLTGAVAGKTGVAEVGGKHFSVLCQPLGNDSRARGRLLVLVPQEAT
ncbi:MAG: response regulator [Rhodospirillales bacterium]|nr:response regulator [Rhodospirillales bacterium]